MIALALVVALQSEPRPAQRMEDLVRLQTALTICDRAGYAPIEGAGRAIEAEITDDLHSEGYSDQRIAELKSDAERVEGGQLRRATAMPQGTDDAETRRLGKEFRATVYQRCAQAKGAFPQAFAPSEDEGRVFFREMGLWLDHPHIEDVAFYLQARGTCSSFQPAFDARGAAEKLVRPFAGEPQSAVASLENFYVSAYRNGLDDASEFNATQCSRLMRSADRALAEGWAAHFSTAAPYGPFD